MAESFVQIAPPSTGQLVRTEQVPEGGNQVQQQVVTLADASGNLVGSTTVGASGLQVGTVPGGQFGGSLLHSLLPGTSTSIQTNGTTTVGAGITASIGAVSGKTSYLQGFDVTLGPGTAGTVTVAVTGLVNTLNYTMTTVATTGNTFLSIRYPYPLPASATNTAVVVTVPTVGGGSAINNVNAYGFQF